MDGIRAKAKSLVFPLAMLAVTILLNSPASLHAQTRPNAPGPPPTQPQPDPALRPPSIRERQFKMAELEREAVQPRTEEELKLALEQVAEDYKRIQIINNRMMSATMSTNSPDYGGIVATTAEIRKRASRIRENLRLPKADAEEVAKNLVHKAVDAAQMKEALLSLDASIMSFIKNPIFENTDVMNLEHAARARRDLETIVEFSHLISKNAQLLSKPLKSTADSRMKPTKP